MQYSLQGQALTEKFEGCSLIPYQDEKGVWTNGYGNTHNVTPGVEITQEQAESDLTRNIQWAVDVVNNSVKVELTQGEFDALVDFVFNLGSGNFQSSTLLRDLNAGNYAGASAQLPEWDKCAGQVNQGLLNRRLAEQGEFNERQT